MHIMQITEIVIGLQLFEYCLSPNKLTSELEEQIYDLILPCSVALSNNSQINKYINNKNYPSSWWHRGCELHADVRLNHRKPGANMLELATPEYEN